LTIEESVSDEPEPTEVTNLPPSLLTSTLKIMASGRFASRVVVRGKTSPVMLKTGDRWERARERHAHQLFPLEGET